MDKAKLRLDILGLSYSQTQSGAYALVLGENGGRRRLPIIIGNFEAQAIAIELEQMKPSRPLTHDIFKSFADAFKVTVTEVLIYNLVDGIFFARLICRSADGTVKEIDTRTSDAIALAVRFLCPIYTYDHILATAGIVLDEADAATPEPSNAAAPVPLTGTYSHLSIEELERELESALSGEDYERASLLRDEIKRRR